MQSKRDLFSSSEQRWTANTGFKGSENSRSNSLSTKFALLLSRSSLWLSAVSPRTQGAAGLDLRALMAYHIASGGLSRSDAPGRRDQSAPTFRPATMMEERALPCYVSY